MALTEKDFQAQLELMETERKALEALQGELSRLNERQAGLLKDAGLSAEALGQVMEEERTPELEAALAAAQENAAKAGKARTARASQAEIAQGAVPGGGAGRPGAVRV